MVLDKPFRVIFETPEDRKIWDKAIFSMLQALDAV
jgi:hypothetical protein